MSMISAIMKIGSLVEAAKSAMEVMGHGRPKSVDAPRPDPFGIQMHIALADQKGSAVSTFIQEKDADKDGFLNAVEFGGSDRAFAKLDVNGDGKLSQAEILATLPQAKSPSQAGSFSASA